MVRSFTFSPRWEPVDHFSLLKSHLKSGEAMTPGASIPILNCEKVVDHLVDIVTAVLKPRVLLHVRWLAESHYDRFARHAWLHELTHLVFGIRAGSASTAD